MVSISANRYSFQAPMPANTAQASRPPRTSGRTTRHMAPSRVQPWIVAASSSSVGIASKKPFIIQTNTGSRNAV